MKITPLWHLKTSSRLTSSSSTSTTTSWPTTTRHFSSSGCQPKKFKRKLSYQKFRVSRASTRRVNWIRVMRQPPVISLPLKRIPLMIFKKTSTRHSWYSLTFSGIRTFLTSQAILHQSSGQLLSSSRLQITLLVRTQRMLKTIPMQSSTQVDLTFRFRTRRTFRSRGGLSVRKAATWKE